MVEIILVAVAWSTSQGLLTTLQICPWEERCLRILQNRSCDSHRNPIFLTHLLASASFLACLDSDWGIRGEYGVIGHGDAKIPLGAAFRSFVSGAPIVTPPNPSASNAVQILTNFRSRVSDFYCCLR